MGGYIVEDQAERKEMLGPWAALDNIFLVCYEQGVVYHAHAPSRPGGPAHCKIDHEHDGRHDYRHMHKPYGVNDLGGHVVLRAGDWSDKVTKIKRCDKYGPLRCRYCGDKYDVDAELAALEKVEVAA